MFYYIGIGVKYQEAKKRVISLLFHYSLLPAEYMYT